MLDVFDLADKINATWCGVCVCIQCATCARDTMVENPFSTHTRSRANACVPVLVLVHARRGMYMVCTGRTNKLTGWQLNLIEDW